MELRVGLKTEVRFIIAVSALTKAFIAKEMLEGISPLLILTVSRSIVIFAAIRLRTSTL